MKKADRDFHMKEIARIRGREQALYLWEEVLRQRDIFKSAEEAKGAVNG